MKNTIPLIIAVVFGLVAVRAVSRTLSKKEEERGKSVSVLVAKHPLEKGNKLKESDCTSNEIPAKAYIVGQQIRYEDRNRVVGVELGHDVSEGNFITLADFEEKNTLSSDVGSKQWAVPVHFADSSLVPFIQRGDEIAILLWLRTQEVETGGGDRSVKPKAVEKRKIRVLFPRKSVIDKMADGVLLSLGPKAAMTLLAAQRKGDLYPVLRKRGDSTSWNEDILDEEADALLTKEALEALQTAE